MTIPARRRFASGAFFPAAVRSEIGQTLDEVRHAARHVARWMKPRRMPGVPALWPGRCRVYPEPLGVALIFSPWNYPFLLSLLPLTAAVAAGDCAVIKPSSSAPATTGVLADILSAVFDPDHVALVRGGALPETGTPSARTPDEAAAGATGNVGTTRPPLCCANASTFCSIPAAPGWAASSWKRRPAR